MTQRPLIAVPAPPPAEARPTTAWMREVDLPAVLEVERLSFEQPWSGEEFEGFRRGGEGNLAAVVAVAGRVLGYALFERRKRSLRILRVAVHPDARRRGLGRALLRFVGRYCADSGRRGVAAEADEADLATQVWLRGCGFPCVRVLQGAYRFVARVEPNSD
jgi:ribosomal-protein-alanine N-acetyltransferase